MPFGRMLVIARNQTRLLLSNPGAVVLFLIVPLLTMVIMRSTQKTALLAAGYHDVTGAEQAVPGFTVMFAFFLAAVHRAHVLRRARLGHVGAPAGDGFHAGGDAQAVELTFEGPAPDIAVRGGEATREGSRLRIKTDNAAETAAAVLGQLGAHAIRLRNVELVRPSLDAIYLALTEQRYSQGDTPDGEDAAGGADAGGAQAHAAVGRSVLQSSGVGFKRL